MWREFVCHNCGDKWLINLDLIKKRKTSKKSLQQETLCEDCEDMMRIYASLNESSICNK